MMHMTEKATAILHRWEGEEVRSSRSDSTSTEVRVCGPFVCRQRVGCTIEVDCNALVLCWYCLGWLLQTGGCLTH